MILHFVPDLYALIGEHDQLNREPCFSLKKKINMFDHVEREEDEEIKAD